LLRAALWNTLLFLAMAGPLLVIVALALALFLNQPYRGRTLGRIVVFAPYVFMSTVVAVIWDWIYDTNFGILNTLIGVRIPWLTSEQLALGSIVIATVWWTVGYNTILFLAGLQDIPQDLYEAGRIDGAGSWGLFRRITLPLLAPTMFTIIMLTIINSFQVFDLVYVMTAGGPGTATLTLVQYLYVTSFQFYRLGYGAAIGYLLFAILVIFAVLQFRSFRQGYQQR
jgi:multiple sugar transport system permease protein